MPLFKFVCNQCSKTIDKIVMHEVASSSCECGGRAIRKLGAPSFKFSRKTNRRTK
jgi:putative FmdB family regulatory protein